MQAVSVPETTTKRARGGWNATLTLLQIDGRSRLARRVKEIESALSASLGSDPMTPARRALVREAAELKALAEAARARFLGSPGSVRLGDAVAAERAAAAAVRALGLAAAEAESKPVDVHAYLAARAAEREAREAAQPPTPAAEDASAGEEDPAAPETPAPAPRSQSGEGDE